ncbi:MAG: hypothetical protein HYY16_19510 [Planctomycetes bacterium]|nr:hypothetical protein [Planctomycetota bacterium]
MEKRMRDRGFTEIDLRGMLQDASGYRADEQDGRWVVETRLRERSWEMVVEPDHEGRLLVLVTAYTVK